MIPHSAVPAIGADQNHRDVAAAQGRWEFLASLQDDDADGKHQPLTDDAKHQTGESPGNHL